MSTSTLEPPDSRFAPGASSAPERIGIAERARKTITRRLTELMTLPSGWDGEDARAIDRSALLVAADILASLSGEGIPEPELFPVPNGGVQIEWSAGPVEIELEIEPERRGAIFVCDDEQSGQRIDGELPEDASRFRLALARLAAYP